MHTVLYIESVQTCREMIHESESKSDTIIDTNKVYKFPLFYNR